MTVIAVLVAIVAASASGGCSDRSGFELFADRISLAVGESRDVFPYIDFLSLKDKSEVTLVSDNACVEVDGTTVIAVSEGEANITVHANDCSAELAVCVFSPERDELRLEYSDNIIQTVKDNSEPQPVCFAAVDGVTGEQLLDTYWSVDGAIAGEKGGSFEFTPQGYGEYTITASCGRLASTAVVKVYHSADVKVYISGDTTQQSDYSRVEFVAVESVNSLDPESEFCWKVNGEVRGKSRVFGFTPSGGGQYCVELTVNGERKKIDGKDSITVYAAGSRAPLGVVVFDERDGVYIEWKDGLNIVGVTIVAPDGTRYDIDRSDVMKSHLFEAGRFDATDYIDVCAGHPGEYKITLTAEGKREFTFLQYELEVMEFLSDAPFMKNMFVSSDADGAELIEDLYVRGATQAKCYLARGALSAVAAMKSKASALGLDATIVVDGSIAEITFEEYCNSPEGKFSVAFPTRMYTELPHIEYSVEQRRSSSYVLDIERSRLRQEAESTEELLLAVMRGVKPEPKAESVAERVYTAARNRLLNIIGAGYTDEQKIHAIYDWLQWVTVRAPHEADGTACSFLEGLFCSDGDGRRAAVTSRGASKAFSLLCAMEGIETAFVKDETTSGVYVWNKVCLDGLWYNVDVYGGKATSAEIGINRSSELNTHKTLLFDDDTAVNLGYSISDELWAFDKSKYIFLNKQKHDGIYYDSYVEDSELEDYDKIKAAVFSAFGGAKHGSVTVPVLSGTEIYWNSTLGAEFMLAKEPTEKQLSAFAALLYKAAVEYSKVNFSTEFNENTMKVYAVGNNIHLITTVTSVA